MGMGLGCRGRQFRLKCVLGFERKMDMKFQWVAERRPASPQVLRVIGLTLPAVSGCILLLAAILGLTTLQLQRNGVRVIGTVDALSEVHDDQQRSTTYAPVFSFTTQDGRTHSIVSHISSSTANYAVGDHVPVLYRRGDPSSARIDSFVQLWFWPMFLAGFGCVGGLGSCVLLFFAALNARKQSGLAATRS
jgi:hypothetical protein